MGSLLAIHTPPAGTPTRTPLQNILETSSLVHHKNPAVEGPVVSYIKVIWRQSFSLKYFLDSNNIAVKQ